MLIISARRSMLLRARKTALNALANYKIDTKNLKLLEVSDSIAYRVSTGAGESYLLRQHQNPNLNSIAISSELSWLEFLHRKNFNSPQGITNLEQSFVTEVAVSSESKLLCTLMSWLPGRTRQERISLAPV
jgi:Ser/Thr protein kinase RdoA (MazF antagonist)